MNNIVEKLGADMLAVTGIATVAATPAYAQQKPNIVMLMTDDTGWNDFGAYGGGANLGHPTPNIDRVAQEGAVFTSWYGQASCTAGRASFITGRIPIRSALSVVIAPGDENGLTKSTPTIAEFFQKNGYGTYFSGKWHLGDQPKFYPIEHGFDEMKEFAAYYPGVYTYDDTDNFAHPWFPKFNAAYWDEYQKIVNLYEWEGTAGKPATKVARIDYEYLHEFDVRQADSAVGYIKQHAKDGKPFFMDVNFMKMHNPNIPVEGVHWKITPRQLLRCHAGAGFQHRQDHGRNPGRGSQHHRHHHRRQWRVAGCLAGRRYGSVSR